MIPRRIIAMSKQRDLWTPSQVTTKLWLDASAASTITKTGDQVTMWTDKKGNGLYFSSGETPTLFSSELNGNSVISFNNDLLNGSSISGLKWLHDGTVYDLMFVIKPGTTTSGRGAQSIIASGNSPSEIGVQVYYFDSTWSTAPNAYAVRVCNKTTNEVVNLSTPNNVVTPNTWQLFGYTLNPGAGTADGRVTIYVNDAAYTGNTKTGSPSTSDSTSTPVLGEYALLAAQNTGLDFRGHIAEIVALSAPSQATRDKTWGYLAHKWGLVDKLPSDHPYKLKVPKI